MAFSHHIIAKVKTKSDDNIVVIRCRECSHIWQDKRIMIKRYSFKSTQQELKDSGLTMTTCPSCNKEIIFHHENVRFDSTNYSNGQFIKETNKRISIGISLTKYEIKTSSKFISTKEAKQYKGDNVYYDTKCKRFRQSSKNNWVIIKYQTLRHVSISHKGIFVFAKTSINGKSTKKQCKHYNFTYKPQQANKHILSICRYDQVKPNQWAPNSKFNNSNNKLKITFMQKAGRILGDTNITNDYNCEDISTFIFHSRRPLLKNLKLHLKAVLSADEEDNILGTIRREYILKVNTKTKPKTFIQAMLMRKPQKSVVRAIATIQSPWIDWPLVALISRTIQDPNHVAPLISKHAGSKDGKTMFRSPSELISTIELLQIVKETSGTKATIQMLNSIVENDSAFAQDCIQMMYRPIYWNARRDNREAQIHRQAQVTERFSQYPNARNPDIHGLHQWLIVNRHNNDFFKRDNLNFEYTKEIKSLTSTNKDYNGYTFILPDNSEQLNTWGAKMHNCIHGYDHKVATGKSILIATNDPKGKMVANIELVQTPTGYKTQQIKGYCNTHLLKETNNNKSLNVIIQKWLETHNIAIEHI